MPEDTTKPNIDLFVKIRAEFLLASVYRQLVHKQNIKIEAI